MLCPNCGKQFEENQNFCAGCGTVRPAEAPVQFQNVQNTAEQNNAADVNNAYVQPETQVQPVGEAVSDSVPTKKKKSKKGFVISAVALFVVAAVVAGIFFIPKFFKKEPDSQFQSIAKNFAKDLSVTAGEVVDLTVSGDGFIMSGSAKISLGSTILGASSELGFLKNVSLDYEMGYNGSAYEMEMALKLSKTEVLAANLIVDLEKGGLYLTVPNLTDETLYIEVGDEELSSIVPPSDFIEFYSIENFNELLPDSKVVEDIIYEYLCVIIEEMDATETENVKLKAGGVSQDTTLLEAPLSEKSLAKVAKAFLKKAKNDKRITKIISDFVDAIGEDGDNAVKEYEEGIQDALDDIDSDELDTEAALTIKLWLNDNDEVIGAALEIDIDEEGGISYASTENGKNRGFEVAIEADGQKMSVSGSGKVTDKEFNGKYTLKFLDYNIFEFGLKDISLSKLEKNQFEGTFTLKFGDGFVEFSEENGSDIDAQTSMIYDLCEAELYYKLTDKETAYKLSLNMQGISLFSISNDMSVEQSAAKIDIPDDYISDIKDWTKGIDFQELLEVLEDAGVPEELIEEIVDEFI